MLKYAAGTSIKARFYYRIYNGQTEDLYGGPWTILKAASIDKNGNFNTTINGLKKGQQYEFKAVVEYNRIEIDGDKKVWRNKTL